MEDKNSVIHHFNPFNQESVVCLGKWDANKHTPLWPPYTGSNEYLHFTTCQACLLDTKLLHPHTNSLTIALQSRRRNRHCPPQRFCSLTVRFMIEMFTNEPLLTSLHAHYFSKTRPSPHFNITLLVGYLKRRWLER